ncbi:hypothetical protein MRX96_026620 [Rhipicephalus microplus]
MRSPQPSSRGGRAVDAGKKPPPTSAHVAPEKGAVSSETAMLFLSGGARSVLDCFLSQCLRNLISGWPGPGPAGCQGQPCFWPPRGFSGAPWRGRADSPGGALSKHRL